VGRGVSAPGPAERGDADERLPGADRAVPGGADQRVLHGPAVLGAAAVQDARRVVPQPAAGLPGAGGQPRRPRRHPAAGPDDRGEAIKSGFTTKARRTQRRRGTKKGKRKVKRPSASCLSTFFFVFLVSPLLCVLRAFVVKPCFLSAPSPPASRPRPRSTSWPSPAA